MVTPTKPNVMETGRYTVTQTCKALGIHRNSLRKYTDEGLIKCIFTPTGFRKLYQGKEILRFWGATV